MEIVITDDDNVAIAVRLNGRRAPVIVARQDRPFARLFVTVFRQLGAHVIRDGQLARDLFELPTRKQAVPNSLAARIRTAASHAGILS